MAFLLLTMKNRGWYKPRKPSWGLCLQDIAELCKMAPLLPLGLELESQGQHCNTCLCCHPSHKDVSAYTVVAVLQDFSCLQVRILSMDTTISRRLNEPPFGDSKLNSCVIQSQALLVYVFLSLFVPLFKT